MMKLAMSVLLISLLSACASDKPAPVVSNAGASNTAAADAAAADAAAKKAAADAAAATAAQQTNAATTNALDDVNSILSKRSAFFDFDKSVVKAEDKPMVQAHGEFLKGQSDRKVAVEGNADERGSSEYNLALGNRRAESVKKMLVLSGAKAAQISAVSFGEEKPRATGHNEAAWVQNRRADIVYK